VSVSSCTGWRVEFHLRVSWLLVGLGLGSVCGSGAGALGIGVFATRFGFAFGFAFAFGFNAGAGVGLGVGFVLGFGATGAGVDTWSVHTLKPFCFAHVSMCVRHALAFTSVSVDCVAVVSSFSISVRVSCSISVLPILRITKSIGCVDAMAKRFHLACCAKVLKSSLRVIFVMFRTMIIARVVWGLGRLVLQLARAVRAVLAFLVVLFAAAPIVWWR
jgi:hypothetical protein